MFSDQLKKHIYKYKNGEYLSEKHIRSFIDKFKVEIKEFSKKIQLGKFQEEKYVKSHEMVAELCIIYDRNVDEHVETEAKKQTRKTRQFLMMKYNIHNLLIRLLDIIVTEINSHQNQSNGKEIDKKFIPKILNLLKFFAFRNHSNQILLLEKRYFMTLWGFSERYLNRDSRSKFYQTIYDILESNVRNKHNNELNLNEHAYFIIDLLLKKFNSIFHSLYKVKKKLPLDQEKVKNKYQHL